MGNVSHGPSIVTDGLVICLDKYNEQSYLGEPTVNLLPSVLAQASSNNFSNYYSPTSKTALTNTLGRKDILQVVCTSSSNPDGVIAYSGDALSSVTVSFSIDVWIPSGKSLLVGMRQYPQGEHGGGSTVTGNSDWQRVEGTYALNSTGTTNLGIQVREVSATDNVTFYLDNLQLEQKSHATKFVDGTRSATDGWQDLSGNLQASGQTFDSDLDQLSYSSTNVPGTNVNSFSFDGTNDYALIRSASDDVPLGNESRTLEAWFSKSNDSSSNDLKIIFGYGRANTNGGHCYLCHNYNKAFFWGYSTSDMIGTTTLTDDVMYHMVATSDGSTKHLYLNAVSEVSDTVAMNTSNVDDWVTIGRYTSGSYRANQGNIDVVRIYNRALSAAEVLRNYNANKGRYGL